MKQKFTLVFLVLALHICNPNISTAQVDVQDSLALVALYNSTDGPHWKNHQNWLTAEPVSTWYGITTVHKKIKFLYLSNNQLSGTIPPVLGELENLVQLILDNNQLSGSIPPELGKIISLHWLNLSNNQLSGSIPPELCKILSLRWLYLFNNQLSGSIPPAIGNLMKLQYLRLDSNQLTGSMPPELSNSHFPSALLLRLQLNNNQLSGNIPPELGKLIGLRSLNLSNNQLSGSIPPELRKLTNLTHLNLSNNQLTGRIPSSLGNLKNLIRLNLKFNQLRGNIPPSLGDLSNLQYLVLNHNHLSGNIPSSFDKLKNIRWLKVRDNKLSGTVPSFLGALPNLKRLVIRHNSYTFDGMETLVQNNKLDLLKYARQRAINIHQNNKTLSVYAGGTLSNNTYKWFENDVLVSTITGDSTFTPTAAGNYSVEVTNSIAIDLTLRSDTVAYTATIERDFAASQLNSTEGNTAFRLYPNPASDALHLDKPKGKVIISILTQDGHMVDKKIVSNSTHEWNVKNLAAGTYYMRIEEGAKITILKFIKQ